MWPHTPSNPGPDKLQETGSNPIMPSHALETKISSLLGLPDTKSLPVCCPKCFCASHLKELKCGKDLCSSCTRRHQINCLVCISENIGAGDRVCWLCAFAYGVLLGKLFLVTVDVSFPAVMRQYSVRLADRKSKLQPKKVTCFRPGHRAVTEETVTPPLPSRKLGVRPKRVVGFWTAS
jgi:hypothetical protein